MSLTRKYKRQNKQENKGRTTCRKCREKLIYKDGYGLVCPNCGRIYET